MEVSRPDGESSRRAVGETLLSRFDGIAEVHSGRVAVSDGGVETSYAELAAMSGTVASVLVEAGMRPGEHVALLLDQGMPAIVAMLASLRAGGAFAPLDPLDPPTRGAALLDLAGCTVLVASAARAEQAGEIAALASRNVDVVVSNELSEITGNATPAPVVTPRSPACVFFTSGSTGRPKAVLDLHRNVLHNVFRYTSLLGLRPTDRLSLIQRPSFSGIASSVFGALLNGATVCTFPLAAHNLAELADWTRREQVTVFHSVPAIFRALVAAGGTFPGVRVVRLEGDRASWADVTSFRRHFREDALLANGLGTTETGLACQFQVTGEMPVEEGVLPVGYPAPDVEIILLDDDGAPVPRGQVGEITVRSNYLAVGYLGEPDLTAARFRTEADGRRLYRTGEPAVWQSCRTMSVPVGRRRPPR